MNGPNVTEEPVRLEGFGPKDLYQKREKIFTRFVGGFFQRLRFFTGWPLLTGYFLLPWFNWGGAQAVLFDLPARQFHIFTLTFYPQDFWLLDLTTMKSRRLTRLEPGGEMRTFDITPDGRRIVFDRLSENSDIVLIELKPMR